MHAGLMEDGLAAGRHRAARLRRDNDLEARQKRRFEKTTGSGHGGPVAPNLQNPDDREHGIHAIVSAHSTGS